jgi:hypothetical protein
MPRVLSVRSNAQRDLADRTRTRQSISVSISSAPILDPSATAAPKSPRRGAAPLPATGSERQARDDDAVVHGDDVQVVRRFVDRRQCAASSTSAASIR